MKNNEVNNQLFNLAKTLLDEDHQLSYKMKGNSMYPTLKPGDVGRVVKCLPEHFKIGDIVVFYANNILVGHRLIKISSDNGKFIFVAKGDNSPHNDAPFTSDVLVGKLHSFTRKNRTKRMDSPKMKLQQFVALHFSKWIIPFIDLFLRTKSRFAKLHLGFRSILQNLKIVSANSRKELFRNILIAGLQGVLPFVIIVCIKSLIDCLTKTTGLVSNQGFYLIGLLSVTALVFLMNGVLTELRTIFSEKLSQSITRSIFEKLHKKHASLDLSHYENPAEQDKIHRAVQEASFRPIKIINELLTGVKSVAAALFMVGLFLSIKWYLVALLFVSIVPSVIIRLKFAGKWYRIKESQSTKEREMYYFNRVLTGFPFAKEMKLFGFFDFFLHRFSSTQDFLFSQKITLRKAEVRAAIFAEVFAIILIFISLAYVSFLKMNGAITIGTVVLFFFAFQRGYSVLNELFRSLTQIVGDNTFLNDFIAFLNMPTKSNAKSEPSSLFSLQKEIKIENVRFSYESSKREALKAINITIPAGKTVAFVGANGSGKTTLIKLLCGFYQPNSGRILFDGVDASQIGQATVCKNITAVFQDFALYNLSALENVLLGNVQSELDIERAKKAVQEAGISEVIDHLPNGYHTLLGNLFVGGEELSIGQWQKMAIARAFYRDSPLLLMDEPSSALDADSELQIIKSLKKLSHQKTAVIISHRLTTVQWADVIYLFDDGEILESGNHQELMEQQGKYFSLFQTANERV